MIPRPSAIYLQCTGHEMIAFMPICPIVASALYNSVRAGSTNHCLTAGIPMASGGAIWLGEAGRWTMALQLLSTPEANTNCATLHGPYGYPLVPLGVPLRGNALGGTPPRGSHRGSPLGAHRDTSPRLTPLDPSGGSGGISRWVPQGGATPEPAQPG